MDKCIAIFVKNLTSGGAEKQAVLLAKSLTNQYDVHFIILNGDKLHQKYLELLKENKRVHVTMFRGGHFSRFMQFVKYLKVNQISTVFSYLTAANTYACMASLIHNMRVYTGLRNAELPLLKLLADKVLTNIVATKAIANCYSGKRNFSAHGFRNDKIEVIPNCFEKIQPYKDKTPKETKHLITVGRFVAQKDYETAIKTIAEVKRIGGKAHFDLVGYGELESKIRSWLKEYDIEDITTVYINPNNIPDLLNKADIYLSTSLFEGTSNSIMEGMNADMPIVCTNVGDNNCLVKEGYNGFLAPIGDYSLLANRIIDLLEDDKLCRQMGKRSKERLQENYSVEIFRKRYNDILKE